VGGNIFEQTGTDTWLLHLDDVVFFDDYDNDVIMQLQVAASSAVRRLLRQPLPRGAG
jgi:hypothetical protein